jgi:segregation and condensation protein B
LDETPNDTHAQDPSPPSDPGAGEEEIKTDDHPDARTLTPDGDAPSPSGEEDDRAAPKKPKPGKEAVEALLFATDTPLSARQIATFLGKRVKPSQVKAWVKELTGEYEGSARAFHVTEIAGGYCLLTKPAFHAYVSRLHASEKSSRLSEAALDTLAVVAYKQPILKADVNQIRGVESGPILKALLEKGLIRAVGRADTLGRPILYGTSRKFLDEFSLSSLKDLPKMDR